MNQPSTPNSTSLSPQTKGCLKWAIGCTGLSVIVFVLALFIAVLLDDDKPTQATSQNTPPVSSTQTTNTPSAPTTQNQAAPLPSNDQALHIAYPEGTYASTAPVDNLVLNVDMEGGVRWRGATLYRDFPPTDYENGTALVEYIATVNNLVPFQQNGQSKLLVVIDSRPSSTPAFEPSLGIAVLILKNNAWILESRSEHGTIGTDGQDIPLGQVIAVGPNLFGYKIQYGWMHQGIVGGMTRLIAQNPDFGFVDFNDIVTSGSNEGADMGPEQSYSFDSKFEFLPSGTNRYYYPLQITWTGTCPQSAGGVGSANITTVYDKCMECEGFETEAEDIYAMCALQ